MAKETKYIFNKPVNSVLPKPQGKNSVNSLAVLSEDREYFTNIVVPMMNYQLNDTIMFMDLFRENALYGLVDIQKDVVYPKEGSLKEIPSGDDSKKLVLDFVADAFSDLNSYLSRAAMTGKLPRKSVYLNLRAFKAYETPGKYTAEVQERFIKELTKRANTNNELSSKIKDAKSFNKAFIQILKELANKQIPVTKTATVLASNFKSFVSGLIIDVAKDKADDDTLKYDKYLSDVGFGIFMDACKRHGFKIDANVPWRIIADLNSPAMNRIIEGQVGYMEKNNISGLEYLFERKYNKTIRDDLEYTKNLFFNCYQTFVERNPIYEINLKDLNVCDFSKQTYFRRPSYKKHEYLSFFSDAYWLRVYAFFRNIETGRNLSQQQFENIVREASNYASVGRLNASMDYLNGYFKNLPPLQNAPEVVELNQLVF